MEFDYDNTLTSDNRSRTYLKIAAAYANVAMRAGLTIDELKSCTIGPINEARARAFAVMMNLAFAFEVALKGKLTEDRLQRVVGSGKGHNLKDLYLALPKAEQDQMRMMVTDILVMSDKDFEDLLDLCKNGFIEWRYFFEDKYKGNSYNYLVITLFLYACVFYLITGESDDIVLEPSIFKKQCYIGQWGFYRTKREIEIELSEARNIAINEGEGIISDSDAIWIEGIQKRLKDITEKIKNLEKRYADANNALCSGRQDGAE